MRIYGLSLFILIGSFLGTNPRLSAQDLSPHLDFFQAQIPAYNRWLKSEGLDQYLSVKGIQLNKDKDRLSLYLAFPFEAQDSLGLMAFTAWEMLKESYDQTHSLTLERALLYQMNYLFEVPLEKIDIQAYDTHDLMKAHNFMRFIYFYEDRVQVDVEDPEYRSQEETIKIPAPEVPEEQREAATAVFKETHSKEKVFTHILAFSEAKYKKQICDDRIPEFKMQESGEVLRFKVYDLCKEVLAPLPKSTLCKLMDILGIPCNMARRERLFFTITYLELVDGVQIEIKIDGKVGSGLSDDDYGKGYYAMEDDFDKLFEDYADAFRLELEKYLKKQLKITPQKKATGQNEE